MHIEVLHSAGSPFLPYMKNKLVIVIDVLRATSTIVTALANGCQAVVPVLTPEEAMEKRLMLPGALLGGERQAVRIEGFDLGNSPYEYVPEKVGGKRIILTTTNGTRAIRASSEASYVWLASFVNLQSIVHAAHRMMDKEKIEGIIIFCAGTEGRFDLPDILCAGMIIDALGSQFEVNDLGEASRILYNASKLNLPEKIRSSDHGKRLAALGFERDLAYCTTPNILPIVPILADDEIIWLSE